MSNISLWVAQVFLALVFLYSGFYKSWKTSTELVAMGQTGVAGLPDSLIHFTGIVELFGVVGIILPWLLQVFPVLTPVTAIGFGLIMVVAAYLHVRLKEFKQAAFNIFVLLLSVYVAVGRFG